MLSYLGPKATTRKKVVVIQAALGAGKTSCIKLIQKQLLEDAEDIHVIFHECKKSAGLESSHKEKTPAEHLDALLAHILNDLQPQQAERHEAPSTKERIQLVLHAIGEVTTRLVILIDDAQMLLEQDGELSSDWQHFVNEVIEHNHHATLFITTRAWPGWTERKDSYLVQTDLEALSPETCIQVWRQLGYVDEREDILRQAARICERGGTSFVEMDTTRRSPSLLVDLPYRHISPLERRSQTCATRTSRQRMKTRMSAKRMMIRAAGTSQKNVYKDQDRRQKA